MKKVILFAAIVFSTIFSYGNNISEIESEKNKNSITINFDSTTLGYERIELNFDSKNELFNYNLENLISNYNFDNQICTGSLEVTVSIGFGASFISVTITIDDIPCEDIIDRFKKLKAELEEAMD